MENIFLSICLPTYNQTEELKKLLDSIALQIIPGVEIVIRDDSTNKNIEQLVELFNKKMPIRYFHGIKEGIDKAIIFLMEQARGDFVWLIGDEIILPGGINKVFDVIKNNPEIGFIWANFYIAGTKKLTIDLPRGGFFSSRDEILEKALAGLGFISATILNRKLALTGLDGARKNIGTEFSNLYFVLHVISLTEKNYYIKEPVIVNYPATSEEIKKITAKNGIINNRALEVFGFNFANILRNFKASFSSIVVKQTIQKVFGQTWRGMLVGWVGGWDTPKGKRIKMLKFFWNFPEAYIAFALFLIPLRINKILYKFYKIFFSHRKLVFKENIKSIFKK